MKLQKNDKVIVITGKDKGREGKVLSIDMEKQKVVVEGVNMVKRHKKLNTGNQKDPGGIIDKPAPIQISNLMLVCKNCSKPTRVGFKVDADNKKWRVCKKCEKVI